MLGVSVHSPWLRAVPAGVKLALLALASAGLFLVGDPWVLGGCFLAVLALTAAVRALALLKTLWPLAVMLIFAFAAHAVVGEAELGLAVCLRIGALVVLATLISASTGLSEMLEVLDRLLRPLRWIGLPTRPVTVAIVMTLRFAPMLATRWRLLGEAWQARSPRRPTWRLMVPFVLSVLDDADHAALALAARGGFTRR